ncbi:ATP-dependent RNA helicase DHX36-like [Diaphorina citri]|uniref:ATP-dependent RNA helicase DHX36-like n=1 Tax=Diaphorina citri TaxID=121845 RepID=A0A3Q0J9G8_DIACI|nr:ATP-dependent RNA helicase DHX36-like [Diaphorina citri]
MMDVLNYELTPIQWLTFLLILHLGLWYRDKNIQKQRAEGRLKGEKVKKTKQEKAVEQIKRHSYRIELTAEKEYHIIKLLGEAKILNPSALPFFNDEPEPAKGKKKPQDDVAFVPYYDQPGPSTSKASTSRNTTSELRGQVEDKYKHVGESAFKRSFLNSISGTLEEKIASAMASNFKLLNDPVLDAAFKKEMIRKLQSRRYQEMLEARKKLPSYQMRDAVLDMVRNNQITVISGETGETLKRSETQQYPNDVLNMLKDPELEGVNNDVIFSLLQHICTTQRPGAILVFLPGWDTINSLHRSMCQSSFFNSSRFQIIPLHSMLPTVSQKSIFNTPPEGVRKIVLATNIAETSITIDDIVYVVDCGKTKMSNFDVKDNIATLKPEWISLANAKQRRGRAGRVQEGVCYHLYSRAREQTFQDYPLPEIQRTRLDEVVLKAKMLQLGKIAPFLQKLLDPPDPASVQLSLKLLRLIDALDDDEHLTPLGYHLAKLPLDPQIGKMLLMASIFSCVDPVFTVAASLGFKDAFYCPMNMEKDVDKQKNILAQGAKSDYVVLINAMQGWEQALEHNYAHDYCRENFLTNNTLLLLRDMKDQFSRTMHEMNFISSRDPKNKESNLNSDNHALVNAVIASGLYPNIGVIKRTRWNNKMNKHFSSIITPDDGKVCIHPKSVNNNQAAFDSPFLMYYMKLKEMNKHFSSIITPDDGKVCIHPKSVNNNQATFDSPFLMYYMKLKGNRLA